jgi:hypothetical protein
MVLSVIVGNSESGTVPLVLTTWDEDYATRQETISAYGITRLALTTNGKFVGSGSLISNHK